MIKMMDLRFLVEEQKPHLEAKKETGGIILMGKTDGFASIHTSLYGPLPDNFQPIGSIMKARISGISERHLIASLPSIHEGGLS